MRQAVCVESIPALLSSLEDEFAIRIEEGRIHATGTTVRMPLCMVFVRPRDDQEKGLMSEAVKALQYWHRASGDSIDIVLPGWNTNRAFIEDSYAKFEKQMVDSSKWRRMGTTSALILDYIVNVETASVSLDLSRCIVLPLGEMIERKSIRSLDSFVTDLISVVESARNKKLDSTTYSLSDLFGVEAVAKKLGTWFGEKSISNALFAVFSDLRNYAVCDLRNNA